MNKCILISFLAVSVNLCAQIKENEEFTPPPTVVIIPETPNEGEKIRANTIHDFPDVYPEFKGGQQGLQTFFNQNFQYPQEAIELNLSGKVYLSFVVEKNGKISNIVVEKGVNELLDKSAVDIIKKMPKWVPGKKDGKKVRVRTRLPINYSLT